MPASSQDLLLTFDFTARPRLDAFKERAAPRIIRLWARFSTPTLFAPPSRVADTRSFDQGWLVPKRRRPYGVGYSRRALHAHHASLCHFPRSGDCGVMGDRASVIQAKVSLNSILLACHREKRSVNSSFKIRAHRFSANTTVSSRPLVPEMKALWLLRITPTSNPQSHFHRLQVMIGTRQYAAMGEPGGCF